MIGAVAAAGQPCRWLLLFGLLGLAACSSQPRLAADVELLRTQAEREGRLASLARWQVEGRLAVSGGDGGGGSGRMTWSHDPAGYRIELRAPVSGQTWRLSVDSDSALLEGLEGGPRSGPEAAALLQQELGWILPLAELPFWIRGARGPGTALIDFDADGLPATIVQQGWTVTFREWQGTGERVMPKKVYAQRGDQRVRLAISRWTFPEGL